MAPFRARSYPAHASPHDALKRWMVLYGGDRDDKENEDTDGHDNKEDNMNMAKILYKDTGRTIEQLIDILALGGIEFGFFCVYDHKVWP